MQPTMKLRWLHLHGNAPWSQNQFVMGSEGQITRKVLQQWWAVFLDGQETPTGEWKDI